MPRPLPDPARLSLLLQTNGAMETRAVLEGLGVSAATLSRLVTRLGPSVIERTGATRKTRYALRRSVRNLGSHWPVYRLDASGRPRVWAELRALYGGFRIVSSNRPAWMEGDYADGLFSGLPFFLQDVRPQGYIGRAIAREAAPRLGTPVDPRLWSDDDVLSYFLNEGYDLPGDFAVGDRALERALRSTENLGGISVPEHDRESVYPERAAAAQRGELVGSSAGGEQPKFLSTIRRANGEFQSVLVKFSVGDRSPVSERWADLLLCEHLAAETMSASGIQCAVTTVIDSAGRRFLEIERFDRVGGIGRRGLITLGALEDAFLEETSSDWAAASVMLTAGEWITAEEGRVLRWNWCFGDLIANSDMHRANSSFWFGDDLPLGQTPFYDMLPMLYAPGPQGDLSERVFAPRPPFASVADVWADAAQAALSFWERVTAETRFSDSFRAIAAKNRDIVQRQLSRFG